MAGSRLMRTPKASKAEETPATSSEVPETQATETTDTGRKRDPIRAAFAEEGRIKADIFKLRTKITDFDTKRTAARKLLTDELAALETRKEEIAALLVVTPTLFEGEAK